MLATLGLLLAGCKVEDCEPPPTVPEGTRFQVDVLEPIESNMGAIPWTVENCGDWLHLSEGGAGFVVEAGSIVTYHRPDSSSCDIQNIAGAPEEFPSDYPIEDCRVGPGYNADCWLIVPECPEDNLSGLTLRLDVPTQSDSAEIEVYIAAGIGCQNNVIDSCAESYRALVTRIDE
jgi:hypothetical protein